MLADRPTAVAALTKIFLDEIERLLCAAAGVTRVAPAPAARPRLGGISFLHRFGSALNHHVHLHACVTDGVFMPPGAEAGSDAAPAFLPVRPITQVHLAVLTERVRRRVVRWFRLAHLLDASAAAAMLAREDRRFSIDASVRITLIDRDVTSDPKRLIPKKKRHGWFPNPCRLFSALAVNHPTPDTPPDSRMKRSPSCSAPGRTPPTR